MPNKSAKTYIKHPTTPVGEAISIATKHAHNALRTLSAGQIMAPELQQKVQEVIDNKLSKPEHEPFRRLIDLHFVQGNSMHDIHKMLGISLPMAYAWRAELELLIAGELFLLPVLVRKNRKEIINMLEKEEIPHVRSNL